jgi:hypothetical protein
VLPESVATIAERLGEAGWETAAFIETSVIGRDSGLLDGFDVIDAPLAVPVGAQRWIPKPIPPPRLPVNMKLWLDERTAEGPWFAWFHFSRPLLEQLERRFWETPDRRVHVYSPDGQAVVPPADPNQAPISERLDAWIGAIADTARAHAPEGRVLIVVAGTLGNIGGGEDDVPGIGYSVAERAVRVPLVVAPPRGVALEREAAAPVWSPDVPATIAALTGIALPEGAEGVSLTETVPADRALLAWSFAPLDQLGWHPIAAARSGATIHSVGHGATTRRDGATVPSADDAEARRLGELLAARRGEPRPTIDVESVRTTLAAGGIEPAPIDPRGRDLEPAGLRREVAELVWAARVVFGKRQADAALAGLERVHVLDPDNLTAFVDRGSTLVLLERPGAREVLAAGLSRYPGDPELLHWYAHTLLHEDRASARALLEATEERLGHTGDVAYDLACVHSLSGDIDAAETWLRRAIEAGYRDWVHMESDPDLRQLRESGRFASVLREYRQ